MMTGVRLLRWIVLLIALTVSVAWAYTAINHLLDSSLSSQQRVSQYHATSQPLALHIQQMQNAQLRWGRQSLFAVACSFLALLAVAMNWVLDGRLPRRRQE